MASFSLFAKLPLELQDLIWEFYLTPSRPIAHFARLELDSLDPYVEFKPDLPIVMLRVYRSHPPSHLSDAYIRFERDATLLQTTSRSRALTRRLNPSRTHSLCSALLLKDPNVPDPLPSLRINTSTDLVILKDGYSSYLLPCPGPGFDTTARYFRYIAINLPRYDPFSNSLKWAITNIIRVYFDVLDVLYVIVDPDVLRQSEDKPWKDSRSLNISSHRFSLERYLKAYTESNIRPPAFNCGTREYFEVPAGQIPKLGGLSTVIAFLDSAGGMRLSPDERVLAEKRDAAHRGQIEVTCEPIRYRLMTWREL